MVSKLFAVMLICNTLICILSQKVYNFYDQYLKAILRNENFTYIYRKPSAEIVQQKVEVMVFYECFCPASRDFYNGQFKQAILKFVDLITIKTYPYGKAKTIINNGSVSFLCQHGPGECYGHMLHTCALANIQNHTVALLYNSCMMDDSQNNMGSDDEAADKCGKNMNVDSQTIKICAKEDRGKNLLEYYGEESVKMNFRFVPYILVNRNVSSKNTFIKDICNGFTIPPPECL